MQNSQSVHTLLVIPLFILMGYLAARAGLSQKLFHAANVWFGHWRGGLAMATVGACAGFGAICGSSVATGAAMCSVALPEMRRYRYADSLSTGAIAAGGTLGILIPPSIIFVIYGIMTEQSIGKLLLAGIVPGLVLTGLFMLAIAAAIGRRARISMNNARKPRAEVRSSFIGNTMKERSAMAASAPEGHVGRPPAPA